jgi:hypothetical protein
MTITGVRLLNPRQAALQTSASSKPLSASPVVGTRIAQKAMTEDSPTAMVPADLPARLDPAPSPELPKENMAPHAGNLSGEKKPDAAAGDTANAGESRPSPRVTSAGQSSKVSGAEISVEQAQRCADLLRKASLESLSREETDFLRRDCR